MGQNIVTEYVALTYSLVFSHRFLYKRQAYPPNYETRHLPIIGNWHFWVVP